MHIRLLTVMIVSAWMTAATGCKSCNSCGNGGGCGLFRSRTPPPPTVGAPVPVSQPVPIPPGGGGPPPAWPPPPAAGATVPPPPTPATRNFSPAPYYSQPAPTQANWQPADPPHSTQEPPTAPKLSAPVPNGDERTPSAWPVGIPGFIFARERIAAGQKPSAEGLDWLRANSYRTVLFVRSPEEAEAADRAPVEQRAMKFQSLEVSPRTLTREKVDEFNRLVASSADLPLFVYDRDGRLAGAFWYLHFRTAASLTDADARQRAAQLGLKDDEQTREIWLAIQNVLSQQ